MTSIPTNLPPVQPVRRTTQVVKRILPVPDEAKEFRRLAEEAGLIANYDNINPGTACYELSFNHGIIVLINPTPERLYELLKLARRYANSKDYGEHNIMLRLSIPLKELNGNQPEKRWRPKIDKNDGWVSIEELLRDHKFDLSGIAEDN